MALAWKSPTSDTRTAEATPLIHSKWGPQAFDIPHLSRIGLVSIDKLASTVPEVPQSRVSGYHALAQLQFNSKGLGR